MNKVTLKRERETGVGGVEGRMNENNNDTFPADL